MIKIEVKNIKLEQNEKIPRIIHYCWFGGKPLPSLAKKCIRSWKKHLPNYKIVCWNENSFDIEAHPYTKEAYEAKKWAFITDYIRLRVLAEFGGIYMDTDVEIIKPLDRFMKDPAFTCFEPQNYIYPEKIVIQTGLLGAQKNNKWILKMLDYYNNKNFLNKFGLPEMLPNPIPLTEITIREFGLKLNQLQQNLDDIVVVYPKEYFCPINWKDKSIEKTINTYAIHHFSGSWLDGKENEKYILFRKKSGLILKKLLGSNIYSLIAQYSWRKYLNKK